MSRFFIFSIAALALAATNALAQPPAPLVRGDVTVRYNDLDLNKPQDAKQMLERLTHAAAAACGHKPFAMGSSPESIRFKLADFGRCRTAALTNAVASLHAPVVDRLYAQNFAPAARVSER